MTAVQKHLGTVMLLLSCAAAQTTAGIAAVQNVTTTREGSDLRVEITLSVPVKPSVETAENPARILLDFPETTYSDKFKNLPVNVNGVRRVRAGAHSARPPVTRIVLDLDQMHPYVVTADGNRVILTVAPAEKARAVSHGAPVAATSGNLIGVFRRRHDNTTPTAVNSDDNPTPPLPPPVVSGPTFEPPSNNSSVAANFPERPSPAPQRPPVTVSPDGSAGQAPVVPTQIAIAAQPTMTAPPAATNPSGVAAPVAKSPPYRQRI